VLVYAECPLMKANYEETNLKVQHLMMKCLVNVNSHTYPLSRVATLTTNI